MAQLRNAYAGVSAGKTAAYSGRVKARSAAAPNSTNPHFSCTLMGPSDLSSPMKNSRVPSTSLISGLNAIRT